MCAGGSRLSQIGHHGGENASARSTDGKAQPWELHLVHLVLYDAAV